MRTKITALDYLKGLERRHLMELIFIAQALIDEYGLEALDVIAEAKSDLTRKQWAEVARLQDRNDIGSLIEQEWEGARPLIEYETTTEEAGEICLRVTKCYWADVFRELGAPAIGKTLYCDDEYAVAEGYGPHIGLSRTRTLMEGHDYCDHCYFSEE